MENTLQQRLSRVAQLPESSRYSQHGEAGIVDELLRQVGTMSRVAVDVGAGDGWSLSNTRHLREAGWSVHMFDGRSPASEGVVQARVTRENVVDLLRDDGVPADFDFLSIDLDGVDYWILERILGEFRPRLICAEFNGALPEYPAVTVPYDPHFVHDGTEWYGASLGAFRDLGMRHGYALVHQHVTVNLFLVRIDALVGRVDFSPKHNHAPDALGRPFVPILR